MNELPNLARTRQTFAAFDAQDVEAMAALVSDDVTLRLGNPPMVHGKELFVAAVRAFLTSVSSVRHEIVTLWHEDETVIAEIVVHYVRLDKGQVALPCCNVFVFRDELISEYRSYMDINPVYE
jgi:ketosteroid isomerase-like protein